MPPLPPPGMPPGPPMLPPNVGGYLSGPGGRGRGGPATKRKRWKLPVIIGSIVVGALALCCGGPLALNPYLRSKGYGVDASASPSRSFDRSKTPPPVSALHAALVSVADIKAAMAVTDEDISTTTNNEALHGGLSRLELCAEGTLAGEAIGGTDSNIFSVSGGIGYPYVGSAVAGFYADEATRYLTAVQSNAERCGWRQLQLSPIGDGAYGMYDDSQGSEHEVALVFVRKGQVILEVAVQADDRGSYQADAVALATAAAKRLPAHP
jgi:hypothetical protein